MTTSRSKKGKSVASPAMRDSRLSVCMIVRDNARTIVQCLESIRPWVDEMVVVDTGSVDETPEICRRLGARIFHFPWIDDFSAARNESLRHATGDWLFWMDSDDVIDEANGQKLRALMKHDIPENVLGFVMQVHCPGRDDELTVVDHVKLLRNLPNLRFEGRIHEQVLASIRRLGGTVAWTDVFVVHSGSDTSPEGKMKKVERDLRILQKDLAERPHHPFVLFNLGMTYHDAEDYETSEQWLRRSLEASGPEESHVRKIYALLVSSLTQLGRCKEAAQVCAAGRSLFPKDPELLFRQGIIEQELGNFPQALWAFRRAMQSGEERHFASIDPGIATYKARHNIARVWEALGNFDRAEHQWRLILEQRPNCAPAWRGLGDSLLAAGRTTLLEIEVARGRENLIFRAEALFIEAKLLDQRGKRKEAVELLAAACSEFPESAACYDKLSQWYFAAEDWPHAQEALASLTKLVPRDGAAWHNLALVHLKQGNREEALRSLAESLRVRPHSNPTRELWGHVNAQVGSAADSLKGTS